jgi:DNA-binding beta-propeller fold protein YncE
MTEDFVAELERQLTTAERLQERGGRLSRLIAPVRAWKPSPVAGLALAAAAAALIAVVVLIRGSEAPTPVGHGPSVVARTWLSPEATNECTVAACGFADPYMGLASGYGSAWIGSVQHGDVLRLDARSHRVVERIPVGRLPSDIVAAAGAVWVVVNPDDKSSTLVRIDPATNRVTDRFPVPSVMLKPRLLGDDRTLWLVGDERGVRFDPRRGAVAVSVN